MRSRARDGALGDLISRLVAPKPNSPRLPSPRDLELESPAGSARSEPAGRTRKVSFREEPRSSGARPRSSSGNVSSDNIVAVAKSSSSGSLGSSAPTLGMMKPPSTPERSSSSGTAPSVEVTRPVSPSLAWKIARTPSDRTLPKVPLLSLRTPRLAEVEEMENDDDVFIEQIAPRKSLVDEAVTAPFTALLRSFQKRPSQAVLDSPINHR